MSENTKPLAHAEASTTDSTSSAAPCKTCLEIANKHGGFGPWHDGSKRCESGSIASGGKIAHCTCDTCF